MNPKVTVLFVIIYLFANNAFGQGREHSVKYGMEHYDGYSEAHKARLKRYYTGFGMPSMGMNLTIEYMQPATGPNITPPQPASDMTVKTKVCMTNGYGLQAGVFFPFMYTGPASAIGFEVAGSGYVYNYQVGPLNLASATITDKTNNTLVGIPIGIEYKSGGEVSMNKRDNSLFTIGCGIAPSMSLFKVFVSQTETSIREYAMMEFGFYQKLGCKIRITYYGGKIPLINVQGAQLNEMNNYKTTGPTGTMNINATGTRDFNFAILLLPFAGKWGN